MTTRLFFAALLAGILISLSTTPAHAALKSVKANSFVQKAAMGNQFEIVSSQLALERSRDAMVKQFAQEMVNDHTEIAKNMKIALTKSNADISMPTTALDAKHQKLLEQLQAASSENFNEEFVKVQMQAHKDATDLFRDYADKGDNESLRQFASQTLPIIEQHHKGVEAIGASF